MKSINGIPYFENTDAVTTDITGLPSISIKRANMLIDSFYKDKSNNDLVRLASYLLNGYEMGLKKAKDNIDLEYNKHLAEKEELRKGIVEKWKKTTQSKK